MSKKVKFNKLRLTRANKGNQASSSISEFFDKSTENTSKNDILNVVPYKNIESPNSSNIQMTSPNKSVLEKLYNQTAKEIKKIKSPKKDSENIITEFFKKNDDSFCDFQESTKVRLAKPKVIAKPKRGKIKRKGVTSIKKFINQGDDELLFNKLLIQQSTIEKVDPEQLQLAMALSKSMEETQNLSNVNCIEHFPTTQERLGNIRNTLEQFGFKKNSNIDYDLPVFLGINKKNKFNKKCTDLIKRNDEKQNEKLMNRVQILLKNQFHKQRSFKGNSAKFVLCSDYLKECFCKEQRNFNINSALYNSQTINEYYTGKLFTPSKIKSGYLLKNWDLIPGREISPVKTLIADKSILSDDDEYIISTDEEKKNFFKSDSFKVNKINSNLSLVQNKELRSFSPDLFADLDQSLNENNKSLEINDNTSFTPRSGLIHKSDHNIKNNSNEILADISYCENHEENESLFNLNTSNHTENESNNLDSIEISDDENIEQEEKNNSHVSNHDISKMENILMSKYEEYSTEIKKNNPIVTDDCSLFEQFEELHESLKSNVCVYNENEIISDKLHLSQGNCSEEEKSIYTNIESNCPTIQEKIEIKNVLKQIGFETYSETENDLPIFVGLFVPKKKNNDIGVNDLHKNYNQQIKIVTKMTDEMLECIEISDDEANYLSRHADDTNKLDRSITKNANDILESEYNTENCINREDTFSLSLKPLLKYYNLNSLKESDVLYQKLISTSEDCVENEDFNKTIEKLIIQTIENDNIDKLQLSLCKTLTETPNEICITETNNIEEELPSIKERMNIKVTLEQLGFKTYKNKQYNLPIFAGVFIPKTIDHNNTINSLNESIFSNCDNVEANKDFYKYSSFLSSPISKCNETKCGLRNSLQEFPNTSINVDEKNTPCEKMQIDSDEEISNKHDDYELQKIEEHNKSTFDCIEISDDELEVVCNANTKDILKRTFAGAKGYSNDSNETIKYDLNEIEYDYPTSQLSTTHSYENNLLSLPSQINIKNVHDDKEKTFSCSFKQSVSMKSMSDLYNKYDVDLNDTIDNLVNNVNLKTIDSITDRYLKPLNEITSKSLTKTKSDSFLLNSNSLNKQNENTEIILSQTNNISKLKRSFSNVSYNIDNDYEDDENYIIKKRNISPEPIYKEMTEIELCKELDKYGLKSLRRKNAINLLEYIYNTTHPFIENNNDTNDNNSDSNDDANEHNEYDSDQIDLELSQSSNDFNEFNPNLSFNFPLNIQIEKELSSYILPSQPSKKIQTCLLPLNIAFKNFLTCNKNINENLLQYKPINIKKIRNFFKSIGLKYKLNDMKDFLDSHGITFEDGIEEQDKKTRKFCVIKV